MYKRLLAALLVVVFLPMIGRLAPQIEAPVSLQSIFFEDGSAGVYEEADGERTWLAGACIYESMGCTPSADEDPFTISGSWVYFPGILWVCVGEPVDYNAGQQFPEDWIGC